MLRLKSSADRWRYRNIELPIGETSIALALALLFVSLTWLTQY
jgi:hypothetical protein